MDRSRIKYTAAAALICASVAATIGIATGAAAPSSSSPSSSSNGNVSAADDIAAAPFPAPPGVRAGAPPGVRRGGRVIFRSGGPIREFGGPPVHSEMVVPTKSGDDFETITQDSGKLQSASSDQLTIVEGTDEATYKTVTLDIPSDATVIRNGKKAELGDLQEGDQVHVSQAPEKTFVYASDSEFIKNLFRHHRGLPPPPGVGGLPPGLPLMAPMARRGH
jgi:hypothetical protein